MAEAYGEGLYSCGKFEEGCNTAQGAVPGAPDTGLFGQPAAIIYPSLLALAIIVGTLSFLISRKLRQRKK